MNGRMSLAQANDILKNNPNVSSGSHPTWTFLDSIRKSIIQARHPNMTESELVDAVRSEYGSAGSTDSGAFSFASKPSSGGDENSLSKNDSPVDPDISDADRNPVINDINKSHNETTVPINIPQYPQFNSASGNFYSNLMNTRPDTENPWNENTKNVLNNILSYQPKTTGDYASDAYGKIVKNLIGNGWSSVADKLVADNSLQKYKLDVAENNERVANENASSIRNLIGQGIEQLQNVKNPEEASALAMALNNIGAKGFTSGMYDNYYLNPKDAATLRGQGASGLMSYDSHKYGSDVNGFNFNLSNSGSLLGRFKGLLDSGQNFGEEGCGVFAHAMLDGTPFGNLISSDCEATLSNAIAKKVFIPANSGYISNAGDAILLKYPGDNYKASHIVISDGHGGYFGNSTDLARKGLPSSNHGNMSDFNNYFVVGYIPSGQSFIKQPSMTKDQIKASNAEQKWYGEIEGLLNGASFLDPKEAYKKYSLAMQKAGADSSAQKYVAQKWYRYAESKGDTNMTTALTGLVGAAEPNS